MILEYFVAGTIYILGILSYINRNRHIERGVTPKVAWKSLIWPLLYLNVVPFVVVFILNTIPTFLGYLLGFKYEETKMGLAAHEVLSMLYPEG